MLTVGARETDILARWLDAFDVGGISEAGRDFCYETPT